MHITMCIYRYNLICPMHIVMCVVIFLVHMTRITWNLVGNLFESLQVYMYLLRKNFFHKKIQFWSEKVKKYIFISNYFCTIYQERLWWCYRYTRRSGDIYNNFVLKCQHFFSLIEVFIERKQKRKFQGSILGPKTIEIIRIKPVSNGYKYCVLMSGHFNNYFGSYNKITKSVLSKSCSSQTMKI